MGKYWQDRLWDKVNKTPSCWLWMAAKMPKGYGKFNLEGAPWLAHRLSLLMHNGNISSGQVVDHICKNTSCVNPAHLELVSQGENIRRGDARRICRATWATKSHCAQGHKFTPENTVWHNSADRDRPRRKCKTCQSAWTKSYRSKK